MYSAQYARACKLEALQNKHKRLSILETSHKVAPQTITNQPTPHDASSPKVVMRPLLVPRIATEHPSAEPEQSPGRLLQIAMEQHHLDSEDRGETLRGLELGESSDIDRDLQQGVGISTAATTGRTIIAQVLKTARDDEFRRKVGLPNPLRLRGATSTLASFWSSAKQSRSAGGYSPEQSYLPVDEHRLQTPS